MEEAGADYRSGSKLFVYLVATVAALGGLLFGYDLAVVSGAIIFLTKAFTLTPAGVGFAIGSSQIGCMIAPFAAGSISDGWGRKQTLIISAVLFVASAFGTALSNSIFQFNVFRIVAGIAIGLASVVSPMYIAEISPARIRGRLVSLNQFAIGVGALSSYAVSYNLSFSGNWRLMFGLAAVPASGFLIGLGFIPQSPRWLVQKDRFREAENILARIDGRNSARLETKAIRETICAESGTMSELFRPGIRVALLVAVMICLFQGWSGGTAVSFYMPIIFQKAESLSASQAIFQTLLLNISSLIFTILTLFLVDRVGRRPLLLVGTAGMAVTQLLLGFSLRGAVPGIYTVVTLFLFSISYNVSLAPLAWLILSEIFPTRLRAKGQAAGTFAVWVSTYFSNQFLGPLMSYFERSFGSAAAAFWLFSLVCVAAFIFGWKMVPETKGKSLEQIAHWWRRPGEVATSRM